MGKINAVITGVGGYVPEYVLNNEELSRMVDTSDEWIMTRVGIKERRILTEEGLGTSYMARKAAKQLIQKTGVDPDTIDALIVTLKSGYVKISCSLWSIPSLITPTLSISAGVPHKR
mgnify:CR=1 FL=1